MKCSLLSLIFLKRSLVLPFQLFSISLHWLRGRLSYLSLLLFGTLHSNGYIFPFLPCLSLLFFSQLFKASSDTILPFCISFPWGWFWLSPPVQDYKALSIVLQALCLPDLISWIYLSLTLYNCKFIPEWPSGFPYLFQFKSESGNKEFMIWATISSWSCFWWCIELLHL